MRKILLVFGLLVFLVPGIAHGQESQPAKYKVGIELENIGNIDRQSGSYELIFWVTIRSDEIDFTKDPPPDKFDFANGHIEDITGEYLEPHFYKFKVRGIFYNTMDFKDYPFENIDLAIRMEPYYPNTENRLVFEVDEKYSGIGTSKSTSVPGWDLSNPHFEIHAEKYPWGSFSQFVAHYQVGSADIMAFMKKLFPVGVLMAFAFASFLLSPKSSGERMGMISASLLSATFFHSGYLHAELPPIGYVTLADKIMIMAYSFFIMCLFPMIYARYRTEIKKIEYTLEQQLALDKKLSVVAPSVSGLIFLVVYFLL